MYMILHVHVDVGYANLSVAILNEYFTQYFDRAADLANQLRDGGFPETFVYTTHPWLANLYLDCPKNFTLANITLQVSVWKSSYFQLPILVNLFYMYR